MTIKVPWSGGEKAKLKLVSTLVDYRQKQQLSVAIKRKRKLGSQERWVQGRSYIYFTFYIYIYISVYIYIDVR